MTMPNSSFSESAQAFLPLAPVVGYILFHLNSITFDFSINSHPIRAALSSSAINA